MTVTPLFGILVWLPFPFLGFQYGFPPPFWDFSFFSGLQYGYRLSSPISGFEECTPKWLPHPFFFGFQHGCHSPFGSLIWPPSPFSDFQNDCHAPVRDSNVPAIGFLGIFTMATKPFFRDLKITAISPFGIPVWLPCPFSGFQYGYRPLFWCLHTAISPFFGILTLLPSPFSAFEGKEKR